jgi:hypothetical protein
MFATRAQIIHPHAHQYVHTGQWGTVSRHPLISQFFTHAYLHIHTAAYILRKYAATSRLYLAHNPQVHDPPYPTKSADDMCGIGNPRIYVQVRPISSGIQRLYQPFECINVAASLSFPESTAASENFLFRLFSLVKM